MIRGQINLRKFVGLFLIFMVFTMPVESLAASQFPDVNAYKGEIEFLVTEEVINGYPDGTFRPTEFVTKKQIAVMISRALRLNLENVIDPNFKDVTKSNTAYREIAAVVNAGIMAKGSYFNPGSPATREMMARAIVLGLKLQGDTAIHFKDVYSNNPNKTYISILADNHITTGYEDGTFKPTSSLTRAHFSVFLARALYEPFRPVINKTLTTQEIVEMHDSRIYLLSINNASQGSGVLLGNGLILTNHHVVDGFEFGSAIDINNQSFSIEGIITSDENKDLALIKLKQNVPANKVSFKRYEDLRKGEKVVAIGNPVGLQNTVSEGIISALRFEDNVKRIQQTAQITNGSSGGGLFDIEGNLIGITTGGLKQEAADLNFSVSINEIDAWKPYLSLAHHQLIVQPILPKKPLYEVVYRNVAFGMSPEEVIQSEGKYPTDYINDTLYYFGITDRELLADVSYKFIDNKLHEIYLQYVGFENLSVEKQEGFFLAILDELEYEYGEASSYDFNWYDDTNEYRIAAYWYNPLMSWQAVIPFSYTKNSYASIYIVSSLE